MATIKLPEVFEPLFQPARYKAFYGGRGSGKSHSIAQALVVVARQQCVRILCCREIQNSIRDSVKRLLDDKIEAAGMRSFFVSTDTEIRGVNESLFVFAGLTTNPDSIKSKEGFDIAWVEEAATVSQRSLDLLIPTLRKPGSELWFTWNPRRAEDPVDVMFRGGEPPPNAIVRRVNYTENPWFPEVLEADMAFDRKRDPEKYAHVWLGEYQKRSDARVFTNWRVESFETPKDARFYFGADWGFSVDPTVLVRCWIKDRTLFVDREAYQVGCEIVNTPALFDTVMKDTPGGRRWTIVADGARPETISHMVHSGFQMIRAHKGAGSVEDGIEFLRGYDIVVHPDCKHTADELALYSYKVDKTTIDPKTRNPVVLPILEDDHNHVIDALRYAVEGLRRSKPARQTQINFMGR